MKRLLCSIIMFAFLAVIFTACSQTVEPETKKPDNAEKTEPDNQEQGNSKTDETVPEEKTPQPPAINISYKNEDIDTENFILNIQFENYDVKPATIDVYYESNASFYTTYTHVWLYKANVSVTNGQITLEKPKKYSKRFFVKYGDIESNRIDIDFVYCVEADSLSTFISSITNNDMVQLQVHGSYVDFGKKIKLFKDENLKISLDLSRLEKPLDSLFFDNCSSLVSVIIPNDYNSDISFGNCINLKKVVLPDYIIKSDYYCYFNGCISLADINIPNGVTTIKRNAFFNCKSLEKIIIPDSVTSIEEDAFCLCTNLSNITLSKNLTIIGHGAFCACKNLDNVIIPDSVTSIESSAFYNCTNLSNITLSKNLTIIGSSAFENCSKLQTIVIPECVHTIYEEAFYNCTNLTKAYFENPSMKIKKKSGGYEFISLENPDNAANLLKTLKDEYLTY